MFLDNKPLITRRHWRLAKNYRWRVLRLSALISILTILVVNTIPSAYLGTTKLHLHSIKISAAVDAHVPLTNTVIQNELTNEFKTLLAINIANDTFTKIKKFSLFDLNSELKNVILEYEFIRQIKQKLRISLPFMPQKEANALSPRQLAILKNNYILDKIIQNLNLHWSENSSEVYVSYKDQNAALAVIISKLAADLYPQSVSATKLQLFNQVLDQIKDADKKLTFIHDTAEKIDGSNHELHIAGLESSIKQTSQQVINLKSHVKDRRSQLKNITYFQSKVHKYGLDVTKLLHHNKITEHPLIKPFIQNVIIVEDKLSNLNQSSEFFPSQINATGKELAIHKKILISNLNSFASNVDANLQKAKYEFNVLQNQLKTCQKERQDLIELQKKINQLPLYPASTHIDVFQAKLNYITNLTKKYAAGSSVSIEGYKTDRLKPNKALIVSLSFILSLSIISILVLVLIRLKENYRQPLPQLDTNTRELKTK